VEQSLRLKLAAVFRIIYHYGWDDLIFTHASARIPGTDHILINSYGLRFDEITASNLLKIDLSGKIISGRGKVNPAGLVIHSAIHDYREDAGCIIHLHTKEGMAVAADKDGLWPCTQRAYTCLRSLAYHDYYGLVVDEKEKRLLKQNLADKRYLIMRNHGILTVGSCVEESMASMRALQVACETQVLINKDRAIMIREDVMADSSRKIMIGLDNKEKPYIAAWNAMYRLVEQKYPEFKL